MKLELTIADDKELRAFIKDLIRSEIVSIARSEIKSIFADVIQQGLIPKNAEEMNTLIKGELRKIIADELNKSGWGSRGIRDIARSMINDYIVEMFKKGALE